MRSLLPIIVIFVLIFSSACSNSEQKSQQKEAIVEESNFVDVLKKDSVIPEIEDKNIGIKDINIDPKLSPNDKARVEEIINKKYLMGQFDPARDSRFIAIPAKLLVNPAQTIYMRTEALEKYKEMQAAALKDGITFKIMSATRPFNIQKAIWERKWQGKQQVNGYFIPDSVKGKERAQRILEWNSMPSTSRHHWGTDIDINNVNPEYWEKAQGKKEYEWLQKHAHEYGFCQPYSKMGPERPVGYQEEKWHWSYLPISRELVKKYKAEVSNDDIGGFLGSETAKEIGVVEIYVLGINPNCK